MELYKHKLKIALSRNSKESFKNFLNPDCCPDHLQNLTSSSSSHFLHFLKISSKSAHKFLSYVANKQTCKQTNNPCHKHNLLGGGNMLFHSSALQFLSSEQIISNCSIQLCRIPSLPSDNNSLNVLNALSTVELALLKLKIISVHWQRFGYSFRLYSNTFFHNSATLNLL